MLQRNVLLKHPYPQHTKLDARLTKLVAGGSVSAVYIFRHVYSGTQIYICSRVARSTTSHTSGLGPGSRSLWSHRDREGKGLGEKIAQNPYKHPNNELMDLVAEYR